MEGVSAIDRPTANENPQTMPMGIAQGAMHLILFDGDHPVPLVFFVLSNP